MGLFYEKTAPLFLEMVVGGTKNAPEWESLGCVKLPLLSKNLANLANFFQFHAHSA